VTPIKGNRYSCLEREDFDICEICHTNAFGAEEGLTYKLIDKAQAIVDEPKDKEGEMFVSHEEAASIVSKFKASASAMVGNEMLMENASKLQRAFFVLVKDGNYDPKAHKLNTTIGIHTIAMGDNLYAKKDILKATEEIRNLKNVTFETRCD